MPNDNIADELLLRLGEIKGGQDAMNVTVHKMAAEVSAIREQGIRTDMAAIAAHRRIDDLKKTVDEHEAFLNKGKGAASTATWIWAAIWSVITLVVTVFGVNFLFGG